MIDPYEVLRSVEWVSGPMGRRCPLCFHDFPEHGLDCKLEMCLQEALKESPDEIEKS